MYIGIPYPPVENHLCDHVILPPLKFLPPPRISLQQQLHDSPAQSPPFLPDFTKLKEQIKSILFWLQTVEAELSPWHRADLQHRTSSLPLPDFSCPLQPHCPSFTNSLHFPQFLPPSIQQPSFHPGYSTQSPVQEKQPLSQTLPTTTPTANDSCSPPISPTIATTSLSQFRLPLVHRSSSPSSQTRSPSLPTTHSNQTVVSSRRSASTAETHAPAPRV